MPSFSTPFARPKAHANVVSLNWSSEESPSSDGPLWPADVLEAFSLRMMAHGLCVSCNLMQQDRRYALSQLAYANAMSDDILRELAQELFQHFQTRQSGVPH